MIFRESNLIFTFPADWIVRKYDETVAYQSLSGRGLKGVDFLCLAPDGGLWFIEVKNYRRRSPEHNPPRRDPGEMAEHVARKFLDSERLIRIVNTHLRRTWLGRLRIRWYARFGASRNPGNHYFWYEVGRRLFRVDRVYYLLWLETPEERPDYDRAVTEKMIALLGNRAEIMVAERQRPGKIPFRVTPEEN